MQWYNWLIVIIPVVFIICMSFYCRRYVRDVVDFLAAGRVCGRYVISVSSMESALGLIVLAANAETYYHSGFAYAFWGALATPLAMMLSLTGFFAYRFRETRAMTLGQYLEMRYSKSFRIFAAFLRTFAEMMANTIGPAICARFFIYLFSWPERFNLFGLEIQTFSFIIAVALLLALVVIWSGGMISLVVTDALQAIMSYPIFVIFSLFVLLHFDWFGEVTPALANRVPGESFLNPFDTEELRDFNIFAIAVMLVGTFLNRGVWCGGGSDTAAKTAHEGKMAGILGTWRAGFSSTMIMLLGISIITLTNHPDFSKEAREIRNDLTRQIVQDRHANSVEVQQKIIAAASAIPEQKEIAVQSKKNNTDMKYSDAAQEVFVESYGSARGNAETLEFRSLFSQMMLPVALRHMLPEPLLALMCLLALTLMLSTDDTRIFSSARTLAQDVVMPFIPRPLTIKQQLWLIRFLTLFVCVCFFIGSIYLSQLDYINLYITIMTAIWVGGAGAVTLGGLYTRFGTTFGAYCSIIAGAVIAGGGAIMQRNWPDHVYPFFEKHGLVQGLDKVLRAISSPFDPYVRWNMDPVKCPINSMELFFLAMLFSVLAYCIGSWITCRKPFNLDKMLHRGIYQDEEKIVENKRWTWRNFITKIIGITPEYTKSDRILAWSVFIYSFVYSFLLAFAGVVIWHTISPWPESWWGYKFFITALLIPCIIGVVSTVWFFWGGIVDLKRLFYDLGLRKISPEDNGNVRKDDK